MMRNPALVHAAWLAVVIAFFVLGARIFPAGSASEGARSDLKDRELGRSGKADRLPGERVGAGSGAGSGTGGDTLVTGKGVRPALSAKGSARTGEKFRGPAIRSSPAAGSAVVINPPGRQQVEDQVWRAIKSANPIERRVAFDLFLEEMASKSLSHEQALVIRSALVENGADDEQLRLFDYAWGANLPEAAVAHLQDIPEQYLHGFLSNMIPGLASVDPQGAISLFEGLQPNLQAMTRKRLFEGLIDHDVEVATDYIYDATNPENYHWRPMDELTREIVKEQGLEPTLEWANGLPEGPLRGSAWSAAYAHWAATDPQVAVQAIIDMPPSQDRNQAVNGFISALAHQDGERAVQWAGEISQPGMREAAQLRAAKQYYQQDPEGATRWFNVSGLPDQAWEQITGQPRPAPVESHPQPEGRADPQAGVQINNS